MNNRLYKAERLNGGGVVKGYYCKVGETITGEASPEGVKHFIIPVGTTSLNGAVEVKENTIVQYTGVKDKNGNEICQYNECRLTVKPFNTNPLPFSNSTARGYINFIDGAFVFVEYIYHTAIELFNLHNKGYEIEIVSEWYDEKLSKTKFEEDDEGESEKNERQTENQNRPFVTVIDHTADETFS